MLHATPHALVAANLALEFSAMFAVLHVSDFALQALLRLEWESHRLPVALLDADRRNAIVIACTEKALAAGVELGQSAPQAMARCPDLLVRTPRAEAEAEARSSLLSAAFSISPLVEATSPGICTIQISGLAKKRREPAVRTALFCLEDLGLNATAGLGSTPLLALYAARRAAPLLAVQDNHAFLRPLPLAAAEPTPELADILCEWGIHTLGDFTALSKAEITHRLGPEGLALWERAAGETSRPLHVLAPAQTFSVNLDCEHAMETLEPLLFIFRRFVDRLALDLVNAGMAAGELTLRLGLENETAHEHTIRLPEPTTDPDVVFRTLHTYLDPLRTEAAIVAVRLSIAPTRITVRQQGFFDHALRDPHGLAETLARATAFLGSDRIGTPQLENAHRPDAFKLSPPTPTLPNRSTRFAHPAHGLALRRYRPPLGANVELTGRMPAYVWTAQTQGPVCALQGPWYGEGDWWETGKYWRREEWDIELENGGLYRLLRTPEGWLLEGEYDWF